MLYDLPVVFDPGQAVPDSVPKLARPAARKMMNALAGRVSIPGPIAARVAADTTRILSLPFAWDDNYPARIGVLPRDGGADDIRWFQIAPCFVFHPLNGYTEVRDGQEVLVLDVVRYRRMFDRDRRGPSDGVPSLDRWEINLATGRVSDGVRDDRQQEFPRINEALTGRAHRFGYTVGTDGIFESAADMKSSLYKHDYATGSAVVAGLDPDLLLGEFCFVPNPDSRAEDDGILMGYAHHRPTDEGRLVMLDAQSLDTMAAVHLPQRVPMGFHGNWCPR